MLLILATEFDTLEELIEGFIVQLNSFATVKTLECRMDLLPQILQPTFTFL
ncbi:MAG: hypothetical protein ABFD16_13355 [Thermoguttaceae bacterium]